MRVIPSRRVEEGRDTTDPNYASPKFARYGRFLLAMPPSKRPLCIIATDGAREGLTVLDTGAPGFFEGPPWEHVSVSAQGRCPTWEEMCWVKDLFWEPEECVIQFHPPRSQYVDCHKFCLHLWRPVGIVLPMPPPILVGPK